MKYCILIFSLIFFPIYPLWGIPVTFTSGGIEKSVECIMIDNSVYMDARELAYNLGGHYFWNPATKKLVLKRGAARIKCSAENRVVIINDQAYYLILPAKFVKGTLYVPLEEMTLLLHKVLSWSLFWDGARRILSLKGSSYNITFLEISERDRGGEIKIQLTEKLKYESSTTDGNWLHITLDFGVMDPRLNEIKPGGPIKALKTYQFDQSTQLSFQFKKSQEISDIKWDTKEKTLSLFFGQTDGPTQDLIQNKTIGFINCIAIDAGHGGKDPGAIGPTGLKEKSVVLDVALRLAKLIKKKMNVKVILTRKDDTFVPLRERTTIANKKGAQLFISIHCNSSRSRKAGGFETYFLAQEKTDEARLVAARENSVIKFELPEKDTHEMTNLDFIMWDISQNEFLKESEDLAITLQKSLSKRLKIKNRGINQAGFYVLKGAFMPNVLAEIAFISNRHEEKLLKQKRFKQAIAEALYESIKIFKQRYERSMK